LFIRVGENEKALEFLNQALALETDNLKAYELKVLDTWAPIRRADRYQDLADLFTRANDKKTAKKLLNQAMEELKSDDGRAALQNLEPINHADKYQNLADSFIEADDNGKALELLGKAAELLSEEDHGKLKAEKLGTYIDKLFRLAEQYIQVGGKSETEKVFERLQTVLSEKKDEPKYEEWSDRLEELRKAIDAMK
jgi:tetratricopeptide (TPR) repeat protein